MSLFRKVVLCSPFALVLVLGGCGKETYGPEICPLVEAQARVCKDEFWARMDYEVRDDGTWHRRYQGHEQQLCESQMRIREAQADLFASCAKIDDCNAWAACAVPAFWHAKE